MSVISAGWLVMIAPPPPRLPAHRLQCKCSPFVSVDQMSQRLLCWSAGLLIRPEQREQSVDRVLPALSLYLHRLCVHTCMENPPVCQTFFTSSRNIFIVKQSYCGTIHPCQPFFCLLFACPLSFAPEHRYNLHNYKIGSYTFFFIVLPLKGGHKYAWFSFSTMYETVNVCCQTWLKPLYL